MQTKNAKIYFSLTLTICGLSILFCSCRNIKINKHANMEYQLFQLYYEDSSGEKGLTTFNYNDEGILEKAIWEFSDGTRTSLNIYKHDAKGNLINKTREFSDSLTSNQSYEFDEKGNLIVEYFERSDSVSGITTYEYNKKGRLEKANCNGLNGWFFWRNNLYL